MRTLIRTFTIIAAIIALWATGAFAAQDFEAKIKISGSGAYDYCVIGMNKNATDGFDNAYDTLAPGGNMNGTYITCTMLHPEWKAIKNEFRGDYRTHKRSDTWNIVVQTNLPAGTVLTMEALKKGAPIPESVMISVEEPATGQQTELTSAPYQFTVTGEVMNFTITGGHMKKVKSPASGHTSGDATQQ